MSFDAVHGVLARLRSWTRGIRRASTLDQDLADEFRLHLELRTQDLVAAGLPPAEAGRQARVEFGHLGTHRDAAVASRGLAVLDQLSVSRLDVKLGLRMLTRYPGLSLVSVLGMTLAIAIAAGGFAAVEALMATSLPLPDDERIVAVQNSNLRDGEGSAERRVAHDFVHWRERLKAVQELSAFNTESRNLSLPAAGTDLVRVARMTASGFRVAGVAPAVGRPLLDEDERAGAPPVLVIGYDEWQRRFGGDQGVVGRQVRLGTVLHTIVGVMPEGFRFPVNHQYWAPLHIDAARHARGEGPAITLFGRLAPGVSLEQAQAEIAALGAQAAAAWPQTHGHLRAQVLPYTYPHSDLNSPGRVLQLQAIKLAIGLLLVVVAVNVSVLVYARTATRMGEIAIRTAVGASRRRVVTQLFVEAAVLAGIAAALGLGIAALVLGRLNQLVQGPQLPFWVRYGLSLPVVVYVSALALLAGVIVGVLPALKVTGRRVQRGLQHITARTSDIQLGGTWTALIVLQVAVAVAALPFAVYVAGASLQRGTAHELYPAGEIMRAHVTIEQGGEASATAEEQARLLTGTRELLRRLEAEPDVAGVTLAHSFPGYEWPGAVDVEGGPRLDVQQNGFGVDLLALFDQPIIAGRGFVPADAAEGGTAVIVNGAFARALGGRPENVLGRRIRWAAETRPGGIERAPGPWLEVVGVVPDFTVAEGIDPTVDPLVYRALSLEGALAEVDQVQLILRLRVPAGEAMAARLRQLAADVDPRLQVMNTRTALDMKREARQALRFLGLTVSALTLSVLLLSAAGMYAMMSFTVARRRREIGIRAALGAGARQVLTGVFARAGAQLGAGVLGGLVVALAIDHFAGGALDAQLPLLLPLVALIMITTGLLAALGPARRGLAIQPTEALRGD